MGLNNNILHMDLIESLDPGIRDAVILLNKYGFHTFESCQGGNGHCYPEPTVRFFGEEFDLIRAYEICSIHGLNISDTRRIYRKTPVYSDVTNGGVIGMNWDKPFNEITFSVHSKTGTIYRPD